MSHMNCVYARLFFVKLPSPLSMFYPNTFTIIAILPNISASTQMLIYFGFFPFALSFFPFFWGLSPCFTPFFSELIRSDKLLEIPSQTRLSHFINHLGAKMDRTCNIQTRGQYQTQTRVRVGIPAFLSGTRWLLTSIIYVTG